MLGGGDWLRHLEGQHLRTALIDGDLELVAAAFRSQDVLDFGDGQVVVSSNLDHAIANVEKRVETIKEACNADQVIVAFSCPTRRYWRHNIFPEYKARRKEQPKPECLGELRKHVESSYRCFVRPHLEADDVLGILGTHASLVPGERVVVSSDKDLNQIPGLHLNPSKLDAGVYTVTPAEGDRFHLFQTLVGDVVDGYPGCPGIGPVRANKILNNAEPGQQWAAVVSTFVRKGKTEADALVQARVARILRAEDWDFEKKEPRLWTPQ